MNNNKTNVTFSNETIETALAAVIGGYDPETVIGHIHARKQRRWNDLTLPQTAQALMRVSTILHSYGSTPEQDFVVLAERFEAACRAHLEPPVERLAQTRPRVLPMLSLAARTPATAPNFV